MKGVDNDLLEMSVSALRRAYEELNGMDCEFAMGSVGGGKADTYGLDWVPEQVIKHVVSDYDNNIVFVTEETGKMYRGEKGLEPTQSVLICDPTDRSIKLHKFLTQMTEKNPDYRKHQVYDVLSQNQDAWNASMGNPAISGASASITAIKNGRLLFNAMVNYVTGGLYIANSLGTKCGHIRRSSSKMSDVQFPSGNRGNRQYVTFLKKPGYSENLSQCNLGLKEEDCIDPWAPGPARILYLSSIANGDASFILSNGEKIGEWMGWLAWAKYARDPTQPDEQALEAYRVFFESPRTKELVLVAPAPHYSIFRERDGETLIDLERMFQLDDPSHYRETLIVSPRHNFEAISRIKALGNYQQELRL